MLCLSVNNSSAQQRVGNVFKAAQHTATKDTVVTKFMFEDRQGKQYKIICSKATGACYIWKRSAKSGKMYKQYMKKEITDTICAELNIKRKHK